MRIQRDSSLVKSDIRCIRDPADSREQMATFDLPFFLWGSDRQRYGFPGLAMDAHGTGVEQNIDAFTAHGAPDFLGDILILTSHKLTAGFDDRHAAAEAAKGLSHFHAGIAAAEHNQMLRRIIELQRLDMGKWS